jgi:hypothetical protein
MEHFVRMWAIPQRPVKNFISLMHIAKAGACVATFVFKRWTHSTSELPLRGRFPCYVRPAGRSLIQTTKLCFSFSNNGLRNSEGRQTQDNG